MSLWKLEMKIYEVDNMKNEKFKVEHANTIIIKNTAVIHIKHLLNKEHRQKQNEAAQT